MQPFAESFKNKQISAKQRFYNKGVRTMAEIIKGGKCCLCGGKYDNIGNNPFPFPKEENERCCDLCEHTKVIPARLLLMKLEKEQFSGNFEADTKILCNVFENALNVAAAMIEYNCAK